jgi:hypothetical protein
MSKLKLSGIELETSGGQTVNLTLDEAKELHDQLHELFGVKYVPSAPIYIDCDRYLRRLPWESPVWCGTSGLTVTYTGDTSWAMHLVEDQ